MRPSHRATMPHVVPIPSGFTSGEEAEAKERETICLRPQTAKSGNLAPESCPREPARQKCHL